jgi:hypothetical protein
LSSVANYYSHGSSDFFKVVVAGAMGTKLNEIDLLEFLLPHSEAVLVEWQAKSTVEYPRVDGFTGKRGAKITKGLMELGKSKSRRGQDGGKPAGCAKDRCDSRV